MPEGQMEARRNLSLKLELERHVSPSAGKDSLSALVLAYLLLAVLRSGRKEKILLEDALNLAVDGEIRLVAEKAVTEEDWKQLSSAVHGAYAEKDLLSFISRGTAGKGDIGYHFSFLSLVSGILLSPEDRKAGKRIAILSDPAFITPPGLKIKAAAMEGPFDIVEEDPFFYWKEQQGKKSDFLFLAVSPGMVRLAPGPAAAYRDSIRARWPGLPAANVYSPWIYGALAGDLISETGRAAFLIPSAASSNATGREMRKCLVESGLVESVVRIPEGLMERVSLPLDLVVVSRGNEGVRFMDASRTGEKKQRRLFLSENDVRATLKSVSGPHPQEFFAEKSRIAQSRWDLGLPSYAAREEAPGRTVRLGDLAAWSGRGLQIPSQELEKHRSSEQTPYRYFLTSNIREGKIDSNLPFLSGIDPGWEKFLLRDGDLVISKLAPFRVAAAKVEEGESILALGNVYIIRIDRTKADPSFIRLFLQSGRGLEILSSFSQGVTVPNISKDNLLAIPIPDIPLTEQYDFVEKAQRKEKNIEDLRRKLAAAEEDLADFRNGIGKA